jgi:hypothetical protein
MVTRLKLHCTILKYVGLSLNTEQQVFYKHLCKTCGYELTHYGNKFKIKG